MPSTAPGSGSTTKTLVFTEFAFIPVGGDNK